MNNKTSGINTIYISTTPTFPYKFACFINIYGIDLFINLQRLSGNICLILQIATNTSMKKQICFYVQASASQLYTPMINA